MTTDPDFITVLRSRSKRLAKFIHPDGKIEQFDDAKHFDMSMVRVDNLTHLHRRLVDLMGRPDLCLVRGEILDPTRAEGIRRLIRHCPITGDKPTLQEAAHHWIGIDVDGVARPDAICATDLVRCGRLVIDLLPGEFRQARAIIQASAGHGLKAGCRLRLWFWTQRPVLGSELSFWMRRSPVDASLFRPAQICYTAAPIFADGLTDHLPCRIVEVPGSEMVETPAPEELAPKPQAAQVATRTRPDAANSSASRTMIKVLMGLETAIDGDRHDRLRSAAYTIGGLIDEAGIGEKEASEVLLDAVVRAGGDKVDRRNAKATITSGLMLGRRNPLKRERRANG